MIRRTLFIAGLLLACALAAPAQELRDSWHALPDQTVLVVRMPQPSQTVEHLQKNTKFGKVMLDGARWTQLIELFKTDPDGEWEEMKENLAKVGLTPEDLMNAWRDPWGMAMVIEQRPGESSPLVMILAWLDADEEKAQKYIDAIARAIEQQEDEENPIKRVDLELGGHKVMHLKAPKFDYTYEWDEDRIDAGAPMEEGFVRPQQMGEAEPGAAEDDGPKVTMTHVDQTNSFITRIGGRVIAGVTLPTSSDRYEERVAADADAKIDYDEISSMKEAAGVFARFLEAHEDEDHDFAERLLATRGLRAVMPKGETLLEIYGDFQPVMKLLANTPEADQTVRWLRVLGISDLTTTAIKVSVDGNVMRSGLFLAAPSPRRGLLSLLDQPAQQPKPAAWAPAHVVDYTHVSFDLGAAYQKVRELVAEEMGEKADLIFQQIDTSVQSVAQADLQTVLTGLGDRHTVVTFESRLAENFIDTKAGDLTRVALVWKLRDEAVWRRLVMALAMLQATPIGQQMQMVEEQGFTGWRLALPDMEQSVMIGKGYLTWAIGNEVSTQILNVLRSEPAGKAALANSDLMAEHDRVFEARPGIAYQLVDGNRQMRQMVATISAAFAEALKRGDQDEAEAAQLQKLREIMPTRDDLEGALGVGGSHAYVTDDGLVSEGFILLPE